jgi:RimJ/RimL family protein N-acetyltransferase
VPAERTSAGASGAGGHRHLLTDRLDLRAVDGDDVAALHRLTSDPLYSDHIPGGLHENPETTRSWIEGFRGRWNAVGLSYWTARLRATGQVIGIGGAERRPGFWNLFYLVDARHWGHGYATELARAGQQAAEVVGPRLPVVAWIHADNAASQAVARHLGLNDYGLLETGHWRGEPMHYWAASKPAGV